MEPTESNSVIAAFRTLLADERIDRLADRKETREIEYALAGALGNARMYARQHDTAEAREIIESIEAARKKVVAAGKVKFGNNKQHPDCDYCLYVSVFGGPDHNASAMCRSGKKPHCTCRACF
jgi:hypothetical protein